MGRLCSGLLDFCPALNLRPIFFLNGRMQQINTVLAQRYSGPAAGVAVQMAHDVFISYASEDKTVADAVCAMLESHRVRCWIAPRDVLPGVSYGEAIIDAIRGCRVMVLVFSSKANTSPHIPKEVERAVSAGAAVLPFRIEDVMPAKSLDYFIGSVHWLDALTPPLEHHIERLAQNVQTLLSRNEVSSDESKGALKYYLYISDAKVDMLLPQVPLDIKKRIATKFNLDLKLLTFSEVNSPADRIARLEAVVSFIRGFRKVGTVDHPDEYVSDSLPMRWGPYGEMVDSPLVYFGGTTDSTIVGLGGSAWHVLGGNKRTSSGAYSHSATPFLVNFLKKELGLPTNPSDVGSLQMARTNFSRQVSSTIESDDPDLCLRAVGLATTQMSGHLQKLEFLSKRLLYSRTRHEAPGKGSGRSVLLGTPLYVAMLD
jgi:hypothetical protein